MSDIRLKKISIENSPLVVQNGYVNITDTIASINKLTGSLVVDGSIAINSTHLGTSNTAGGSLTIGGSLGITNKAFFGNDLILDNNTGVLRVDGILENRLFLDTITNKQFYISPDGNNKRFELYDTFININITKPSTSITTAGLIINGGISINNNTNSINNSNGGALTVNGGAAFGGDIHGKSLTLYSTDSSLIINYGNNQVIVKGNSQDAILNMVNNDLNINNDANINIYTTTGSINLNTFNSSNTTNTFSKYINITDTVISLNNTTGSLIVNGGITIKCTELATSPSSGSGLTVFGGIGVVKSSQFGDTLGISMKTLQNNKIILYHTSGSISATSSLTGFGINGSGIQTGSMMLMVRSTDCDYTFYAGSSSTEVFKIKGSNEVQFIGSNQRYSIIGGGYNSNSLSLQGQTVATETSLNLFTYDGDNNDNNDIKIFGLGLPNNVTDSENISIGWDQSNNQYNISTVNSGTGVSRPMNIQTGTNTNQILLKTDSSVLFSSNIAATNSSTAGVVLSNGGLSINNNVLATNKNNGGGLTVRGGGAFSENVIIGSTFTVNVNELSSENTTGTLISKDLKNSFKFTSFNTNKHSSEILLYSLNDTSNTELLSVNMNNTSGTGLFNINTVNSGTGLPRALILGSSSFSHLTLQTDGNTLTGNLNVNGVLDVNTFSFINGLHINNTVNSTGLSTGSLIIDGGVSIKKDIITDGLVKFLNTVISSNSSTASVVLDGGLSINNNTNSTDVSNGGSFTTPGGASFGQDVYIGGNLIYANPSNVGNTFAYLTLTGTAQPSLITYGRIQINDSTAAINSTTGSVYSVGGIACNSLYVGTNILANGLIRVYDTLQFNNTSNIKRYTLNLNGDSIEFNRFNSSGVFIDKPFEIDTGILKINGTQPSTNSTTAGIISNCGLSITNTTNAVSLNNGGGLTVIGGGSIGKDFYVGGDLRISSTTVSSDISSGALIVQGGFGLSGNLNVLGNTILNGNLTVVGSSTNMDSTNTTLKDNIFVLNSGPSGSKDSGFIVQRFQNDNDTASGDVVADTPSFSSTLPLQTGMTSTQVKFGIDASSVDDFYNGWWILFTNFVANNQVRKIIAYNGTTRVATLSSAFSTSNPGLGDSFSLYNKPYVGLVFNEILNTFELGSTISDPGQTNITLTDYMPITVNSAKLKSTLYSSNSSTGSLVLDGGFSINNTMNSVSLTEGGSFTFNGGGSIKKTLRVGESVYINGVLIQPNTYDVLTTKTFTAGNVLIFTDITDLVFDSSVWGADIYITSRITATTNLYNNAHLRVINKGTNWELVSEYVGDNVIDYSITSSGQIQYVNIANFPGFIDNVIKYKVLTN